MFIISKKLTIITILVLLSTSVYSLLVSFEDTGTIKQDINRFMTLTVPEGGSISYVGLVKGSLEVYIPQKALYHEALGYKNLALIKNSYDSHPEEDRGEKDREENGEEGSLHQNLH